VLAFNDLERADAAADVNADVFRVLRRDLQPGEPQRFLRGRNRELNELADLLISLRSMKRSGSKPCTSAAMRQENRVASK